MIGKAEWFESRKYGGWGLTPNCWQGWAYIGTLVLLIGGVQFLPILGNIKTGIMLTLATVSAIDFMDIFRKVKRDERDVIHEAIADRNALWFMIIALIVGLAYKTAGNIVAGKAEMVDPIILGALLGAAAVKSLTHWYLRDK